MNFNDVLIVKPSAKPFKFYTPIAFDTEGLRFGNSFKPDSPKYRESQEIYNYDLYDGKTHFYGTDLLGFYDSVYTLMRRYNKITLFGHFIRYDLQILDIIKFILKKEFLGLHLQTSMIDNVIFIKFRSANKEFVIQYLDTYNYFRTSLNELAKKLGLSKTDIENYKLEWKKWNAQLEVNGEERVKTDCEILYKVFTEFLNDKDFVHGVSIASTSFKTLKQNWLKRTLTMPKCLIDSVLESYRGGRTEIYRINNEPLHLNVYDINSLYPYVMRNKKYSYKFHKEVNSINFDDIENADYNYLYNIDYTYQDKPLRLPIVVKDDNGKLTQIYSKRNVWLTGQEVLELYKQNVIITFRAGYEFFNDYLFTDFIDYFYNKRLNSTNKLSKEFYKYIMNTSYGTMGQHKGFSEIIPYDFKDEQFQYALFLHNNTNKSKIEVNDVVYSFHNGYATIHKDLLRSRMHNPLIASEITANARLENYYWQRNIGFEHIFYTDTDSFFIDREWSISKDLGKLKLEKSGIFMLYDVKDYSYIDDKGEVHITLKGIPKDSVKVDDNTYIVNSFSTLKSQTKNGIVDVKNTLHTVKRLRDKLQYIENEDGLLIGVPM